MIRRDRTIVWTKRRYWSHACGSSVRIACGDYEAWEGSPRSARLVVAGLMHVCLCCGSIISKGRLHGADEYPRFTDHYCLDCLTNERPETRYKPLDDPPGREDLSINPQRRWAS